MGKFNWRALVGTVAPTLGAALGGPLGGMAGSVLAKTLLGKEKASDAEIATAMASATPEQLLALKKADQEFAVQMKTLDVDIFKLETEDVQSARQLYAINYWPQITISAVFLIGYIVMMFMLLTGKIGVGLQPETLAMVQTLMGVLTAGVTGILGFWFGSSFGSREKTAALAASKPGDTQ